MKKTNLMLSVAAISMIAMTGCSNKNNSTEGPTAIFSDSPVEGLSYVCDPSGVSGQTTSEGKLTCKEGDKAEFQLGAMTFGPVTVRQDDVITPYRIYPDDNEAAVNLAQLLQSLDDDGDIDTTIKLDEAKVAAVTENLDPTADNFDDLARTMFEENNSSIVLVAEDDAQAHLNEQILKFDNTDPIVTLQGDAEVEVILGGTYTEAGATANDDVHGMMTPVITGTVDTSTLGTYTITYSATDAAGKEGSATRTVKVIEDPNADKVAPVVTLTGEATVTITVGDVYTDAGATATDNVDGTLTPVKSSTVDTATAGTYTVTWTATDAAGNETSVTRTVIVKAETAPTPTTPEELEASAIGDSCVAADGSTGTVAKDQDPFGNIIPNSATCEVEGGSALAPTTAEELEASAIGDSCVAADGATGTVAKDQDPFGNIIPNSASCTVAG